jgi:hypothetical protein
VGCLSKQIQATRSHRSGGLVLGSRGFLEANGIELWMRSHVWSNQPKFFRGVHQETWWTPMELTYQNCEAVRFFSDLAIKSWEEPPGNIWTVGVQRGMVPMSGELFFIIGDTKNGPKWDFFPSIFWGDVWCSHFCDQRFIPVKWLKKKSYKGTKPA